MKRFIVLLITIAVLLVVFPAFADSRTPYDYTDDILEDGRPIYYFRDLSLTLPAGWRGRVMALQDDSGTSFYQTASYHSVSAWRQRKQQFYPASVLCISRIQRALSHELLSAAADGLSGLQ